MKRITALALSVLGLAAVAGCTPAQLRTWERVHQMSIPTKVERQAIAAPNVRITGPSGWINTDGSITPYVAPLGSLCPDHFGAAMQAGWAETDWSRLDAIIYRESRCQPTAYNGYGPDNSYGITQLNMKAHRSWVGPLVGWDFNRLYDPVVNLTVARQLYFKAVDYYGCGWQPWAFRC